MAGIIFTDKSTVVPASWLNGINNFFFDLFQGSTTVAEAKTALGITDITNPLVITNNTAPRIHLVNDSGDGIAILYSHPGACIRFSVVTAGVVGATLFEFDTSSIGHAADWSAGETF